MSRTPFSPEHTALVVPIPEAEPVVGRWRRHHDPHAAGGVGPHVTVLFPFLPMSRLDTTVVSELTVLFTAHRAFDVTFGRCGLFPDWLYLAPEPAAGFAALTRAVMERWRIRPYDGEHEPVPHLSVAKTSDQRLIARIRSDLEAHPFTTTVSAVTLSSFDGAEWRELARLPLSG